MIGADRSLTGYAGGLERKRALLVHEAETRTPKRSEDLFLHSLAAG